MNQRWNTAKSDTTHARLQQNAEEWQHYHALYRDARKTWAVVPFERMVKDLSIREGYVVGDFGCGEALLAERLGDTCTVHSFDHVAANDAVNACDIADVPLDDSELDVTVFCLSLMGSNFTDYLKEAHRTLKLDGRLHIYEATSRFSDRHKFAADLERLGFGQVTASDEWKFTHIVATKDSVGRRQDVGVVGGLRGESSSMVSTEN
jgi:ubiquinone/menaquinone biosynthesis C-methylase UbiE